MREGFTAWGRRDIRCLQALLDAGGGSEDMLEFSQESRDGVVVLKVKGRLDAVAAPELRPTIDKLVEERQKHVVFDLSELQMIDSSGVGAIVSLFKRLRMQQGDVKIAQLTGQPKEIFRLLRLDRAFDLYESLDEAIAKFKK
jgi:anti-sigma B factor antagonist